MRRDAGARNLPIDEDGLALVRMVVALGVVNLFLAIVAAILVAASGSIH